MPAINLTDGLRREYEHLFNTCIIRSGYESEIEGIIEGITRNRARYQGLGKIFDIPWYFIAVIHNTESGLDFSTHLHNGDPLTRRTTHEPVNRPLIGEPPFTWEQSAADALRQKSMRSGMDWGLAGTLYQIERYNGWGYRLYHPHVLSPYLWSYSNHYTSGKYVKDGLWSDTAVSKQCGAAVVLRRMAEKLLIDFMDQPAPDDSGRLVVAYSTGKPADPKMFGRALELQRWLNTFPGIFVKVDGIPGEKTSAAYRKVTGHYLPGDPRT